MAGAAPVETGGGGRRGRGLGSRDCDLSPAPVIDCFVVLITFLLVSAAFLSIGILDAGIAAAGAAPSSATPPPVNVVVELQEGFRMEVRVSGKLTRKVALAPTKDGSWDYPGLTEQLAAVKNQFPGTSAATLQATDRIEYREVVKSMEAVRRTLPAVLLGGF
jgi:biopolymer transport protein ExbD